MADAKNVRRAHLAMLAWQGMDDEPACERFRCQPSVFAALREHVNPAAWA